MSYNLYNLDGVKTQIQKDIARAIAYRDAWKAVTFPVKKDGQPFKLMYKNIDGATYRVCEYAMQPAYEHDLTVYTHADGLGYIHDTITLYEIIRYLKDPAKLAKTGNYAPKESFLEQVYVYDLDDIKTAVADRIAKLEKQIAALEKQLSNAETAYHNFIANYKVALDALKEDALTDDASTLFTYVKDTVLSRYPYC